MSQIIGKAFRSQEHDLHNNTLYKRIVVSSRDTPTKGWKKNAISTTIEYLRKEGLIRVHKSSLDVIDKNNHNILYEISLLQKGIDIARGNNFSDYYRAREKETYRENLEINEKKFTIYSSIISLFALITSVLSLAYSVKSDNKIEVLKMEYDKSKSKIDSLEVLIKRISK